MGVMQDLSTLGVISNVVEVAKHRSISGTLAGGGGHPSEPIASSCLWLKFSTFCTNYTLFVSKYLSLLTFFQL
jgi:hypothetical protein